MQRLETMKNWFREQVCINSAHLCSTPLREACPKVAARDYFPTSLTYLPLRPPYSSPLGRHLVAQVDGTAPILVHHLKEFQRQIRSCFFPTRHIVPIL